MIIGTKVQITVKPVQPKIMFDYPNLHYHYSSKHKKGNARIIAKINWIFHEKKPFSVFTIDNNWT